MTLFGAISSDQDVPGKSNSTATTAPGVGNDNTQGYVVGSFWVNTSTNRTYVCSNTATGAAVWTEITAAAGSGAPTDAKYIVQQGNATLSAEQALGDLATGILKNTITTGVLSIAAAGTDYAAAAHTHTLADITDEGALASKNTVATADIDNAAVTNAKLANMTTKTYKGRTAGTTGDPEDVAVATLKTDLALVKADVGLGNVDNTSDASKPVSTATQTALDNKQPLDSDLTTIAGLTATTDNFMVSAASAWASRTPAQAKTSLGLVKGDVGLGNVDNTSDASKPVSTATQTALDLKAPLASPTFTGTVTIPTPFTLGAVSVLPTGTELNFVDGVTSNIQTQLDGKQATLVSGTNIKTVNSSSLLGAGNLVVSASITETEIDVGTTPVAEGNIAVTDAGVTASSKIIGGIAYKAPTGKDLDELEMDALGLKFEPGSGTFNVKISGLEGYIADKFVIWYQFA